MQECIACGVMFEDSPEGDGINFDPADRLIHICRSCCIKIVRRTIAKGWITT